MPTNNKEKIWDVIVVGGGASGLMSATIASSRGLSVLLLDKNKRLGEKLKITGGGRCNITNNEPDFQKFMSVYGAGAPFLYSPFSIFGVKDTFNFFESRGLPLVEEARYRVFPVSEKATDVVDFFEKQLIKNKVKVENSCLVLNIIKENNQILGVKTNKGNYKGKSFILATGGLSHPETGSTGDGFKFLRDLGHNVSDPSPDIVPIEIKEDWPKKLSGLSLSFMKITFFLDGQKQFSKKGKILFTHFGLSGPLILNSAKLIKPLLVKGKVTAEIDLYPDSTIGGLEDRFIKILDLNKNKILKNVLPEIMPEGFGEIINKLIDFVDLGTKVHSLKKEDRARIVRLLKSLPLTVLGLMGLDRAVVTDGGVSPKEIDTKTMRSKLYNNLYITGDLLNISRNSGGFSLQICWTTGYVAGVSV
jgi:predicted Rossmann fold flavoprotein